MTNASQELTRKVLQSDPALLAKAIMTPVPDGPRLETFDPLQMAQAIEYELNRCAAVGWPKINITMTVEDAALVAAYLRRASKTVR